MSSSGFLRALDDQVNEPINENKPVNEEENREESSSPEYSDQVSSENIDAAQDDLREANSEDSREPNNKWNKVKAIREQNRELEKQNRELAEYVQKMNAQLNQAETNSVYNYGTSTIAELQSAEEDYKRALKEGNVDDVAAATANYTMALNNYKEAEKAVAEYTDGYRQSSRTDTHYVEQQKAQYEAAVAERDYLQRQWLRENPEIDRNSRYYNPKLEQVVIDEAEKLNQYLASEGATHLIGSREYLDKLEEYVEYYKNEASSNLRGYGMGRRNKDAVNNRVSLTPIEANIAASLNMTPAEYKASQARMPEDLRTKQQMLRR